MNRIQTDLVVLLAIVAAGFGISVLCNHCHRNIPAGLKSPTLGLIRNYDTNAERCITPALDTGKDNMQWFAQKNIIFFIP
jgi:hypothetical protein